MTPWVECYSGSVYPERPRAFDWNFQHYRIQEVIQRRREPDSLGFIVRTTAPPAWFELIYNFTTDNWQIRPFEIVHTDSKALFPTSP